LSDRAVILFHSSNYAMWAVDVLKQNKIENKLIPVPRDLSSDCGYCIQIDIKAKESVIKVLKEAGIEFDSIKDIE